MSQNTPKNSSKKSLTYSAYLEVTGLIALARSHMRALQDIQLALIGVTAEIDSDGTPMQLNGCGHCSDACYDADYSVKELLRKLGLEIPVAPKRDK